MPQWARGRDRRGPDAPEGERAVQELRRVPGAPRRESRTACRPGSRHRRGERSRQVDAHEDPRRRLPGGRRNDRARRHRSRLRSPGPGPTGRPVHGVPGVQPPARAHDRREHLPRTGAASSRSRRHRPDEPRHRGPPRRARRHRTSTDPARAVPVRRRAAGRRDRQGSRLRRAHHPDGRAHRIARRARGRAAPRHHRQAHQPGCRHPVRLAPAQGDLRALRHHHHLEGRRPGRHEARRRARRGRAGAADGRSVHLVVLPRSAARHRSR